MRLWGLSLLVLLSGCTSQNPEQLSLYAASSLTELAQDFQDHCSIPFEIRTESSGHLAREILNGAPADIFISADPKWLDSLEDQGIILAETRCLIASNTLVVAGAPELQPLQSIEDLRLLDSIAMGEFTSVPAGRYTQEVLKGAGLWPEILPKCVFTRDVRSALSLLEMGQTQAAIVFATDVLVAKKAVTILKIPEHFHTPIRIEACVVKASSDPKRASQLLREFRTPAARDILESRGFIGSP